MRLRLYCVTVLDNWTPAQFFWTHRGATRHYQNFRGFSPSVRRWERDRWVGVEPAAPRDYTGALIGVALVVIGIVAMPAILLGLFWIWLGHVADKRGQRRYRSAR